MGEIYIIGTEHDMLPRRKNEFQSLLKTLNPDQILVEIVQKDLKSGKTGKYPKEMVFAAKWGNKNKKVVMGFDAPIEIARKDNTKQRYIDVLNKVRKLVKGLSWEDINRKSYPHKTEVSRLIMELIDKKKHDAREKQMLKNVRKMTLKDGKILILTGAMHLDFFEKHIKGAIFPLRK